MTIEFLPTMGLARLGLMVTEADLELSDGRTLRTARLPSCGLLLALATLRCSIQPRRLWSGCATEQPFDLVS